MSQDEKPSRSMDDNTSVNKNISISGDVVDSAVIVGDHNTVNQTFIQKFFNIFKSDAETLEQRNRRILLNHVENAWIKGVLDASLHGAALLDLGIKQDPEAVTKYPWAIKKESTDETLPAGTSMLEIFDSIGMGRSLLILGAPGSGKTTMLLELARQLIARAREDVTQPIPMVFNLASWTEKLTLVDWLAQELNNLYSVPRKTAPDWVKDNKLLLLLDGLDEVRQESRTRCVEAINEFRKQNGMTSLAVCSRSQEYADAHSKLSFEGAVEVQPLTQGQIAEFFSRFGDEMTGIKQALEKDSKLRGMAETPLFLSIMLMAYRDKRDVEILVSGNEKTWRKRLFDNYIDRMFERRSENVVFKRQDVLHWLPWLAKKIFERGDMSYLFEHMQRDWLSQKQLVQRYRHISGLIFGLVSGLSSWLLFGSLLGLNEEVLFGLIGGSFFGLIGGLIGGLLGANSDIKTIDKLTWDVERLIKNDLVLSLFFGILLGISSGLLFGRLVGILIGLSSLLIIGLFLGINSRQIDKTTRPGQSISSSIEIFFFVFLLFGTLVGVSSGSLFWLKSGSSSLGWMLGLAFGIVFGCLLGLIFGGFAVIQHYTLRVIMSKNNFLPWQIVPFLDYCVDLIFLRRVGGGYIFVHRLLMEHFAEMYMDTPTSKGN